MRFVGLALLTCSLLASSTSWAETPAEDIGVASVPPAAAGWASTDNAASDQTATVDGQDQALVEEMIVTADRILTREDRRRIYDELKKARKLYAANQIEEALPYLLNTAERGFKDSQAKVGHIYLSGLGVVEPDTEQAVGWLGVASSGTTSPTIRNYFNSIWKRIPDRYVPYFEEVVEEYRTKYGEHATGVVCDLHRPLRTHLKQLGCFFEDDLGDDVRHTMDEFKNTRHTISLAQDRLREAQEVMDQMRDSATPH